MGGIRATAPSEPLLEGAAIDPAHGPGVAIVDAVDDPQRSRRDEVTGRNRYAHPRHGGIGEPQGQQGLQLDSHDPGGLLDAGQGRVVRDPKVADVAKLRPAPGKPLLDLRPGAVDQHQAYAEAVEEGNVVYQAGQSPCRDGLAAEGKDERPSAVGVDVGRGLAKPGDEGVGLR